MFRNKITVEMTVERDERSAMKFQPGYSKDAPIEVDQDSSNVPLAFAYSA